MKKILKIIGALLIIVLLGILFISYLTNHNEDYLDNMTKSIQENYDISEEITYSNQYGNYYVVKTPSSVIVLNKEYQEVLKESSSILAPNINNYALIYKTNKLMYENTIVKEDELTYEYYDAKTNELIKTTTMERK